MTRHKQIVIAAAIAVSGMLLYAIPAQQQLATATLDEVTTFEEEAIVQEEDLAQRLVDRTQQDIDQDARQRQAQDQDQRIDQDLDQTNTADVDQSEENNQANAIVTGDNTASTTQIGDNDATGTEVEADSEGGTTWAKSHHAQANAQGGDSTASGSFEQEVDNEATTNQDSSADGNVLVNENRFGDDVSVVDQDNRADQTATNLGIQTQDQDIDQYATNVDVTGQSGEQAQDAFLCDPDFFAIGEVAGDTIAEVC